MKIVVPYGQPKPERQLWALPAVKLSLKQDGHEAEYALMSHDDSYYELMKQMWGRGDTFTVIEHDIVTWPGWADEMEACPKPWCTRPYYCSLGWILDGLGCTKFGADVMRRFPNFFYEPFPTCCNHSKFYCGLDRLIAHRMEQLGMKPCVHLPGVTNLNERWT